MGRFRSDSGDADAVRWATVGRWCRGASEERGRHVLATDVQQTDSAVPVLLRFYKERSTGL